MTENVPTSPLAIANAIRRGHADFARQMRALRDDHGVSASKLSALGQLHRAKRPISATELARRESLQPQSLTRIIADLEDKGLIKRSQNEQDRRQFDIAITAAGAELLTLDARRQNDWLARAMSEKLTLAERAVLALAGELFERLSEDAPPRVEGEIDGNDD